MPRIGGKHPGRGNSRVPSRLVGALLVGAAACAYGSGPLFARSVYATGADWLTLLAWRFTLAAAASWVWLLARPNNRASLRRLPRRRASQLFAVGTLFAFASASAYASLELIPVALYGLIQAISPALVAALAIRFGRRLDGRRAWLALAIATAGVALTIGGVTTRADPIGVLLAVGGPSIYSVYLLLVARAAGERRWALAIERSVPPVPPAVAGTILLTGTWAVLVTWAAILQEPAMPWQLSVAAWPGLLAIGLISGAFAIQALYAGTARIGAAQAALVSTLEPVSTVILAILVLGEGLGPFQVCGGLLVLTGVVLSQTNGKSLAGTDGGADVQLQREPA